MVYHLHYKILSLVLYATGNSVNFLAKSLGDILLWIFVAHFFYLVNMALYMPTFTTAAPLPIYNMERCTAELCDFFHFCKFAFWQCNAIIAQ